MIGFPYDNHTLTELDARDEAATQAEMAENDRQADQDAAEEAYAQATEEAAAFRRWEAEQMVDVVARVCDDDIPF